MITEKCHKCAYFIYDNKNKGHNWFVNGKCSFDDPKIWRDGTCDSYEYEEPNSMKGKNAIQERSDNR